MNDHAHHAESALDAARTRFGDHAIPPEVLAGMAQAHASLAIVHELREARRSGAAPEPPAAPVPAAALPIVSATAGQRALQVLDEARDAWGAAPRGQEGDAAFRAAVDDAIGILGGVPF